MGTTTIDIPDELLELLCHSPLGMRPQAEQVKIALAMYLAQEGAISVGKAAELAGETRPAFEQLMGELGLPVVRYDEAEYERDLRGLAEAERRARRH
jgi:predicted HTH domain antitoxin